MPDEPAEPVNNATPDMLVFNDLFPIAGSCPEVSAQMVFKAGQTGSSWFPFEYIFVLSINLYYLLWGPGRNQPLRETTRLWTLL